MADDEESLDDILSTPATPVKEAPEAETPAEPVRDEHGRFAPKHGDEEPEAPETPPEQVPDEEPEGEHNAPVASVVAERRKRQAAESERNDLAREIAELRGQMSVFMQQRTQPQQQPPQPEPKPRPQMWDDPDQWGQSLIEERLSPIQQQIAQMTYRASRAEALAEFGKDTVTTAQQALEEAVKSGQLDGPKVKDTLSKSSDPVGDIVRWHQNRPEVRETSMREKLEAEILAKYGIDPTAQTPSPTPSPRNPNVKLPPSLSRIPSGHQAPERDESLDEVLSVPRRRA
jgi:hypothetical protein